MRLVGLSLAALPCLCLQALAVPLAPARAAAGVLLRRSDGDYRYANLAKAHAMFLERGWWHLDGTIDYERYPWDRSGRLKPQYVEEAQRCLEQSIDAQLAEPRISPNSVWSIADAIQWCQEYVGGEPKVSDEMAAKLQRLSDRYAEESEPADDPAYEDWEWDVDMENYQERVAEALEKYGTKPRRKYTWIDWRQPGPGADADAAHEAPPPVIDGGPLAFSHAAARPALEEEKKTHVLRLSSVHQPLPAAVARALKARLGLGLGTHATRSRPPSFSSVGAYVEWKKQLVARESGRLSTSPASASASASSSSFFSALARQARRSARRVESTAAVVWRAAQHS
ncbi:MAG: hypothetical protein M1826_000837 [Phylliscum demangeonii]|nr:MAG: hypothetical protein M1826_000837 [Phylliscum demangeonii]